MIVGWVDLIENSYQLSPTFSHRVRRMLAIFESLKHFGHEGVYGLQWITGWFPGELVKTESDIRAVGNSHGKIIRHTTSYARHDIRHAMAENDIQRPNTRQPLHAIDDRCTAIINEGLLTSWTLSCWGRRMQKAKKENKWLVFSRNYLSKIISVGDGSPQLILHWHGW